VARPYPDLDMARNYPTIGPSGEDIQDVNGRAAALELYLGVDALRDGSGDLRPVRWMGHQTKVNAYQGKVTEKGGVQQAFRRKLEECEGEPSKLRLYDWEGIEEILGVMRSAFLGTNTEAILESLDFE